MTNIGSAPGVTCGFCGTLNPGGALLCDRCGSALASSSARPEHGTSRTREAGWSHIPGPVDRESFYRAQRRHRRATWRLAAVSAVAALITGIPMSIALTPVLYALAVFFTWLSGLIVPWPQQVWDLYLSAGRIVPEIITALDEPATANAANIGGVPLDLLARGALVWLTPGMVFMLACWLVLRSLFRHGGAGGVLLTIGARSPSQEDFHERQLVNVVEEIAIAAGLPAPDVMLLDSSIANAAVVGSSRNDATLIVSRALLDDLDRDATQGLLANLVASIGNGDLRGARSILAVFETFGLAGMLLKLPVSSDARRMLWRIIRYIFSRHPPEKRASEAQAVSSMLSRSFWENEKSDIDWLTDSSGDPGERRGLSVRLLLFLPLLVIGGVVLVALEMFPRELIWFWFGLLAALALAIVFYQRDYLLYKGGYAVRMSFAIILLPYYMAVVLPQFVLQLIIPFMLEPMIALVWRRRRYLGDAAAVQLTRNPDGIARGLAGLVERGGVIPGGHWASPMFVVGPEAAYSRQIAQHQQYQQRARELREQAGIGPGVVGDLRAMAQLSREQQAEMMRIAEESGGVEPQGDSFSGSDGGAIVSFHPPLNKRLQQLRRLGSTVSDIQVESPETPTVFSKALAALLGVLVIPLILLAAALMVVAVVLLMALSLLFCGLLMVAVYGLAIWLSP